MKDKIQHSKPVPPFVRFCAANIPMVFDDSLSYYECLCALWNWLQTDVIDVINNNATVTQKWREELTEFEDNVTDEIEEFESDMRSDFSDLNDAFDTLKTWVETYFNNLDVQQEINKKLDAMVEAGTLQEIIDTYIQTNVAWTFDTVADMQNATNLIVGSFAQTLGYYSKHDGGGAIYKIVDTTDSDHLYVNAGTDLYGEIIFTDGVININALGADNTGTNDSSSVFNTAFAFINSQWLAGNYRINTVVCDGTYKWLNQVKMPPCARLRGSGYTVILTNVTGSALLIDYLTTDTPSGFEGNKQDWLFADLIRFDKGGLFKNIGTDLTNTGIEIGRDSDIGATLPYSRYRLSNFRIYNYAIGMLHNRFHNYMGNFERISFENNAVGVQYGKVDTTVSDSGENMTYTNCLFASGTDGVKFYVPNMDSSFINCSFDFLTNNFNRAASNNRGYTRISAVNCHFEGFTYFAIGLKAFDYLVVSQSSLMFVQNGNLFNDINNNAQIFFNNNKILPSKENIKDPTKTIDVSTDAILTQNLIGHNVSYCFEKSNLLNCFDNIADGAVGSTTITANDVIGDWKVESATGSWASASIVTDNYLYTGHKSLVLTVANHSAGNKNVTLMSNEYIPIDRLHGYLFGNTYTYNCCGGGSFAYYFYDENKQEISHTSGYHEQQSGTTQNTWYISPYNVRAIVPARAVYFKVKIAYANVNNSTDDPNGTQYTIGGMIVN